MDKVEIYTELHKSDLIKIYKVMLEQQEKFAPQTNSGFKGGIPKVKRPKIGGEIISWRQFSKLPKAAIIVHIYMDGLDPETLAQYLEENPPDDTPSLNDLWLQVKDTPNKIGFNLETKSYYIIEYATEEE